MELMWSPSWVYVPGGAGTTVTAELSAGPDVRYQLDGLDDASTQILKRWSSGVPIAASADLDDAGRELSVLLTGLGVLTLKTVEPQPVSVTGAVPEALVSALRTHFPVLLLSGQEPFHPSDALELVFRTETDWPAPGPGIHLGVDITHHHTLVLGPLVVPSSSSCLQCLDRLTSRRWGTDAVPTQPSIQRWSNVISELIAIQLEAADHGRSTLVNATASWNLSEGLVDRQPLLRAPDCGGPCRSPSNNRIPLPWESL